MRVAAVSKTLDGLKRVADAVVHPADLFEPTKDFELMLTNDTAPAKNECKGQSESQDAADEAKRAMAMHPVVIDEPLEDNREGKDEQAAEKRDQPDHTDGEDPTEERSWCSGA